MGNNLPKISSTQLRGEISGSLADVWRAVVSPAHLRHWWHTEDTIASGIMPTVDLRPGGQIRVIAAVADDGTLLRDDVEIIGVEPPTYLHVRAVRGAREDVIIHLHSSKPNHTYVEVDVISSKVDLNRSYLLKWSELLRNLKRYAEAASE